MAKIMELREIGLELLKPNDWNPNTFHITMLNKLKESIKAFGFAQPLWVRQTGDYFEIIGGEQRYKAALDLGLEKVPCYVFEASDFEAREMTLVKNQLKGEHNPIKEKEVLRFLLKERSPEELELLLTNRLEEMGELLKNIESKRHVEFEAGTEKEIPLMLKLLFIGEQKKLMNEALNMTGKKEEADAILTMAIFFRNYYGRV